MEKKLQAQAQTKLEHHPARHMAVMALTILITGAVVAGAVFAWLSVSGARAQKQARQAQEALRSRNVELELRIEELEEKESQLMELEEQVTAVEEAAFPDIELQANEAGNEILVLNRGQEIGYVLSEYPFAQSAIFHQTNDLVYIEVNPDGLGGYILYGGAYSLYEANLLTNEIRRIFYSGIATDISPDGKWLTYVETEVSDSDVNFVIALLNLETNESVSYNVPQEYGQAGGATFSPNGKKIAYSAAVGDPENESSAIYVIDLETGEQTLVTQKEAAVLQVLGWHDNERVKY
ncbi:PD40 domain-containing protein [Patescibacteria group bacterium]|nr:PD40 domain-containing protein [Patescibacteria group bacterium]